MSQSEILKRIAEAIEKMSPIDPQPPNFDEGNYFVWSSNPDRLNFTKDVKVLDVKYLFGIEDLKNILIENTRQFAEGYSANNALLWGARGMGKSSLVVSVSALFPEKKLKLIEISREDLGGLSKLISLIKPSSYRFIIFCDDLSFGTDESEYKTLKALLDGGLQSRPENIIFYATSNRRHLIPRDMIENESSSAINPSEAIEEKISLSDRFGLWLGFHKCSQQDYFNMVKNYKECLKLSIDDDVLFTKAIEWQQARGSRSGRVAWQFVSDLAGRSGVNISKVLYKSLQ